MNDTNAAEEESRPKDPDLGKARKQPELSQRDVIDKPEKNRAGIPFVDFNNSIDFLSLQFIHTSLPLVNPLP